MIAALMVVFLLGTPLFFASAIRHVVQVGKKSCRYSDLHRN